MNKQSKFRPAWLIPLCILVAIGGFVLVYLLAFQRAANTSTPVGTAQEASATATISPSAAPSDTPTPSVVPASASSNAIASSNGEISAEVVRKDGAEFDTVVFTDKNGAMCSVDLADILSTGIENAAWVDDLRFALLAHVNPSLQTYVVVDAKKSEILNTYEGIGFTWNQRKDRLYYIQTSPHFAAEKTSDKIVDSEGTVYYETEPGISMTSALAISDDEKMFAFFVSDDKNQQTRLYIAALGKGNTLEKKADIPADVGDIVIIDNKTVRITTPDGAAHDYEIPLS